VVIVRCDWQVNGRLLPAEIALLQRLACVDGVIHLLDHFEQEDCFLIVMERPTPCEDLFDYITRRSALPEPQARDILRQTISILTAVHQKGVFHRDIKDENMLIDAETGRVRLIDFGSAAFARNNPYSSFGGMSIPTISADKCCPRYLPVCVSYLDIITFFIYLLSASSAKKLTGFQTDSCTQFQLPFHHYHSQHSYHSIILFHSYAPGFWFSYFTKKTLTTYLCNIMCSYPTDCSHRIGDF